MQLERTYINYAVLSTLSEDLTALILSYVL